MNIANYPLDRIIKRKGIPKNEVAERMGLTRQMLHQIIKNPKRMRIDQAEMLAEITGYNIVSIVRMVL